MIDSWCLDRPTSREMVEVGRPSRWPIERIDAPRSSPNAISSHSGSVSRAAVVT